MIRPHSADRAPWARVSLANRLDHGGHSAGSSVHLVAGAPSRHRRRRRSEHRRRHRRSRNHRRELDRCCRVSRNCSYPKGRAGVVTGHQSRIYTPSTDGSPAIATDGCPPRGRSRAGRRDGRPGGVRMTGEPAGEIGISRQSGLVNTASPKGDTVFRPEAGHLERGLPGCTRAPARSRGQRGAPAAVGEDERR